MTPSISSSAQTLPDYVPVPASALGPALNEQGYYVGRVERNLFWVTDGTYQSAFLLTGEGVVLFDAPPTIGHNLRRAVDEMAEAEGVTNAVTHLVYSHHHADHAGAANLFGDDIMRIGHEETRRLLLRDGDPTRPAPEVRFQDAYTLNVADDRVELAFHGPNHSPDNIFIHFPDHDALDAHRHRQPRLGADLQPQPHRRRAWVHRRCGQGPLLPMDALHRGPPGPARHPRRRHRASGVRRGHR